jgi:hypothetical protein
MLRDVKGKSQLQCAYKGINEHNNLKKMAQTEQRLPKKYEKRLLMLDKDLQAKVKRSKNKEKALKEAEETASDRNRKDFMEQYRLLIGRLPTTEYNRIFKTEKWDSNINLVHDKVNNIKAIVAKSEKEKRERSEIKKLDSTLVEKTKTPLRVTINRKLELLPFWIFSKEDSNELTEKKWDTIKKYCDNLKGDIVRIDRILKFYEIPINVERRGRNRYVYGVKNLNFKKRRIYISEKCRYESAIVRK